ncbi:MAG: TrkA C-terminal domain-containing protein [Bacteroidota bacterium]
MKNNTSFKQRSRYWFDNIMGRGAITLIIGLALISVILVGISAVVLLFGEIAPEGEDPLSYIEGFWRSLMRTLDPGTMGGDQGWGFRILMLFCTLVGIFVISALIGIINNAISEKLENLRKGRSFVVESNHTLILGWSNKIFAIISELTIANENQKKARIVILADKDKVEMEEEINVKIPDTKNTKVICRSGSCIDMDDLHIVNPYEARSIIILSPETENPDIQVLKTVLAITNNPNRRKEPYHIVSEMLEMKNLEVGEMVGKDEAIYILSKDIISRMIVQTCRQSGLSVVYTELLDYDGDEIYFKDEPALIGKTFADTLYAFETSTTMGIIRHDNSTVVNPPMDTVIQKGDRLIVITADDDTCVMSAKKDFGIDEKVMRSGVKTDAVPERTLILGWNEMGKTIAHELDNYVTPGSYLKIVADIEDDDVKNHLISFAQSLKNQKFEYFNESTTDRSVLDTLELASYDHIIVLSYSDQKSEQEADAVTLITLLHIRDISEKTHKRFNIVSEILDVKNRELASVTKADDFIVSDKINSLMLAQLSENKYLKPVFDDLFDADGSEIYVKPAVDYVESGVAVNFYTVTRSAAMKNEIAIGYKLARHSGDASMAYGVKVNPAKAEMVTFEPGDKLIVIAED